MEQFKAQLERRRSSGLALLATLLCTFAGYGVLHYIKDITSESGHLQSFAIGFSFGILAGVIAVLIWDIVVCHKALKSDVALRKLYVKETDERTKMIKTMVGGTGIFLLFFILAAAAAIASFMNVTVSITLICVLGCMSLIILGLKLYYNKKY